MEYLYIIGNDDFLKVGVTNRPSRRLSELQDGAQQKLQLKEIWILPGANRSEVLAYEREVHKRLRQHHVNGEWFRADRGVLSQAQHAIGNVCGDEAVWLDVEWEPAFDRCEYICDCDEIGCVYPVSHALAISASCLKRCVAHEEHECVECAEEEIDTATDSSWMGRL